MRFVRKITIFLLGAFICASIVFEIRGNLELWASGSNCQFSFRPLISINPIDRNGTLKGEVVGVWQKQSSSATEGFRVEECGKFSNLHISRSEEIIDWSIVKNTQLTRHLIVSGNFMPDDAWNFLYTMNTPKNDLKIFKKLLQNWSDKNNHELFGFKLLLRNQKLDKKFYQKISLMINSKELHEVEILIPKFDFCNLDLSYESSIKITLLKIDTKGLPEKYRNHNSINGLSVGNGNIFDYHWMKNNTIVLSNIADIKSYHEFECK